MRPFFDRHALVSVVIPTYNRAEYTAQAIQSVLAQTYNRYEVIVVDDGSADETSQVLRNFGNDIKYLYQENHGPSGARNAGIRLARGKYICFLDADDLWTRDKLEIQRRFMEHHPHIGLLFSAVKRFNGNGVPDGESVTKRRCSSELMSDFLVPDAFIRILRNSLVTTSTVMVKKECFEAAGMFDETLRSVEDRDMWLRIAARFPVARLPLVLCHKRVHESNISSDQELALYSRIRVLEKNYSLFPDLAPSRVWKKELGELYLKSGYNFLIKNRRKDARKAAFDSLKYHPTVRAVAAVGISFMSWPMIQYLRKAKRASRRLITLGRMGL